MSKRMLRSRVGGACLEPGDAGYDRARSRVERDDRPPARYVARARGADVRPAIRYAADHWRSASRCRGTASSARRAEDGIMSTSPMGSVTFDPSREPARARRARLGALDRAAQAHGSRRPPAPCRTPASADSPSAGQCGSPAGIWAAHLGTSWPVRVVTAGGELLHVERLDIPTSPGCSRRLGAHSAWSLSSSSALILSRRGRCCRLSW